MARRRKSTKHSLRKKKNGVLVVVLDIQTTKKYTSRKYGVTYESARANRQGKAYYRWTKM